MSQNYETTVLNPENPSGERITATIPHSVYSRVYKNDSVQYENIRAACFVLENTARIFKGVRDFNQGGWCFTGRPINWYIREDVVAPFPGNLVYAVYMNPNYTVYEWRAEKCDAADDLCPVNWRSRYTALVWKNTP